MNIWKVSHSPSDITDAVNDWLYQHHYIAVHKQAKKGQATKFAQELNIGEVVHLNRGNANVGLFVVGSALITDKKCPLGPEWFLRKIKPIQLVIENPIYSGQKKGWTPNYNSACYKVPSWDLDAFEAHILQPSYQMSLSTLEAQAIKSNAMPLVEHSHAPSQDSLYLEHPAPPNTSGKPLVTPIHSSPKAPLNQILCGPPGTGKTFKAMQQALSIIDPAFMALNTHNRAAIKGRFDALVKEKRIGVVSFHPNFTYDDFVEGIKATTDENNPLSYHVEDGVFKTLADEAGKGVGFTDPLHAAIQVLIEKQEQSASRLVLTTKQGKQFEIEYEGGKTFKVFPESMETSNTNYVASISNVKKLYETGNKQGIYNPSYVDGLLRYLQNECGLKDFESGELSYLDSQPFVLIIDEIHRGDVATTFGELISLIEPSKRAGCSEAMSVTLPYSKETFCVPANLYLIGTMSTLGKSRNNLDNGIRRRFEFVEIETDYDALARIPAIEGINIQRMVQTLNQRIELLLDKDHALGQSLFMPLLDSPSLARLARIFERQIIPLLHSYFNRDWEAISQTLGDMMKSKRQAQFIVKKFSDKEIEALMGKDWENAGMNIGMNAYTVNTDALLNPAAYIGMYAPRK